MCTIPSYQVFKRVTENCAAYTTVIAGVPGGLVGGQRAYQDQFRGFKSRRVHTRRDFFLHKTVISAKLESVS